MTSKEIKRIMLVTGVCMSALLCGCVTDQTRSDQRVGAFGESSEVQSDGETETLEQPKETKGQESPMNSEGSEENSAEENGYEVTGTAEYTGEVYTYKISEMRNSVDEGDIYWQIDIYNGETPLREIKAEKVEYLSLLPSVGELVHEEDVDFDGQKDLLVFRGLFGAQGAAGYDCYLIRGEEFVFCPDFADIPNPAVDEEKQVISGWNRNSASSYSEMTYRFNGTDFEMIERKTYEYDEETGDFVLVEE